MTFIIFVLSFSFWSIWIVLRSLYNVQLYQNSRQIGPGVTELWLDRHIDRQPEITTIYTVSTMYIKD